jgi:Nucleotidyl transferase of unknown function (DUF2204)
MTQYSELLRVLQEAGVRFIVIGGVAAIGHGSARFTQDVDVVYERSPENLRKIVAALRPYSPYLRGAPPGLPFRWDEETLRHGLNFTLTTQLGPIDLLGEIVGGGDYPVAARRPARALRAATSVARTRDAHSDEARGGTAQGLRGDCGT